MSKAKVLPFTGNWHLDLGANTAVEAKAQKALRDAEAKETVRAYTRPRKAVAAVGWSDPSEKLLTVKEVADHFRISQAAVYRATSEGELVAEYFGKAIRFSRAEIDRYKTRQHVKKHG